MTKKQTFFIPCAAIFLLAFFIGILPVEAASDIRYASLRNQQTNLRSGPGEKYPIEWVLTRKKMPVKVVRKFDVWRQIELIDGDKGWVHQHLLSGLRTALVDEELLDIHAKPRADSKILLRLEAGVVVKLDQCAKEWCSIEISGYEGWAKASSLWGNTNEDD